MAPQGHILVLHSSTSCFEGALLLLMINIDPTYICLHVLHRLVIAYGNGLIVLWGLHEIGVLAIRGGTKVQRKQLKDHTGSLDRPRTFTERVADSAINIGERFSSSTSPVRSASSEEEEDEKEICTICWACQSGSTVAAGYVDGDIWLWKFPTSSKEKLQGENSEPELPSVSGSPLRKIDLVPGKSMKMPVILLKWSASNKGGKGGNGHLFVYGGSDLGATQALTVSPSTCYIREINPWSIIPMVNSIMPVDFPT